MKKIFKRFKFNKCILCEKTLFYKVSCRSCVNFVEDLKNKNK